MNNKHYQKAFSFVCQRRDGLERCSKCDHIERLRNRLRLIGSHIMNHIMSFMLLRFRLLGETRGDHGRQRIFGVIQPITKVLCGGETAEMGDDAKHKARIEPASEA